MRTNLTPHSGNLYQSQSKDTHFATQLVKFYEFLKHNTVTCTQASVILGIPQKSLCRLKRLLEKGGMLWEVKKTRCPITNHYAATLTTNPATAPVSNQLKLFSHDAN